MPIAMTVTIMRSPSAQGEVRALAAIHSVAIEARTPGSEVRQGGGLPRTHLQARRGGGAHKCGGTRLVVGVADEGRLVLRTADARCHCSPCSPVAHDLLVAPRGPQAALTLWG